MKKILLLILLILLSASISEGAGWKDSVDEASSLAGGDILYLENAAADTNNWASLESLRSFFQKWTTGTSYTANINFAVHGGNIYVCTSTHSSGSTTEPGVGASWATVWSFWGAALYEPLKGADDNFVTDAEKVVIGNTSGTNTGDQNAAGVSIVDAGGIITATNVEGALQENRTAIDLNTAKTGITAGQAQAIIDNTAKETNTDDQNSTEVSTVTTNFDNNLSSADDTVQKALETLDEISGGGTDDQNAGEVATDTTNFDGNLSAADTTVQAALETLDGLAGGAGTDDQAITEFTLTGTDLTITLEGDAGGQESVSLSSLQDGTGTDDQNASEVSIADAGALITATDVEGALQENRTAIDLNTNKVTFDSTASTKVGHLTVTQAVDLDTMESNVSTNNSKVSYTPATPGVIGGTTPAAATFTTISADSISIDAGDTYRASTFLENTADTNVGNQSIHYTNNDLLWKSEAGSNFTFLFTADVDDTPVNGVTGFPVSSNWAYDHENDADAHRTEVELEALLELEDLQGSLNSSQIATIVESVAWLAGGTSSDGTQCDDPSEATINSGPIQYTTICADNDGSTIYGSTPMPDSWNGGTVTMESQYLQTASDTSALNGDIAMQCRGSGETVSNTWGTEIAIDDAAVTGSNAVDHTTSAAITPSGTCSGGDTLYWRYQLDATGTTTAVATLHFLAWKMEYTSNVGD